MNLEPLQQFFCDQCGQLIEEPEHGYVEWHIDNSGWHIVHHANYSPLQPEKNCYAGFDKTIALTRFLGPAGMAYIIGFLDVGEHLPDVEKRIRAADIREFVEFVRRVTLPYYEEARQYWDEAKRGGFFEGANESWPYAPDVLKQVIERYGRARAY